MSVEKAYSRRQLITVAEVASTFAAARDIAGLEAVQQLAQAVQDGRLCPDLYPPHQRWVNNGQAERIGSPEINSAAIWGSLSKKSVERHLSDKDDFNYPPAASTWHMLADDVFAFADDGTLSRRAAAALRELAVRYKAELGETGDTAIASVSANHDSEYLAAWAIHEKIDQCKAAIERWQELERKAPTPSEVITAEQRLVALRQELESLGRQASGAEVMKPAAEQSSPPELVQAAPAAASAQQSVVVQVVVVNAQALPSTTEPDPVRAEPAVEQVLPSAPMQAAPATEQSPSHEPVQRSSAQGAAILDAIRKAGHEPRSLPNRDAGKRGIKALVRNELVGKHKLFPKDGRQFDKAWERLRAFGEIAGGD